MININPIWFYWIIKGSTLGDAKLFIIVTNLLNIFLLDSDSAKLLWIRWYNDPISYLIFYCHSGYGDKLSSILVYLYMDYMTSISKL